jgi:hypothetical protein
MALQVRHNEGRYYLTVSPPHADESQTAVIQTPTEALKVMSSWGCHQTDAIDALDATGVNWRPQHDAEVMARRQRADGERG